MFVQTNYKAILADIASYPLEKADIQLSTKVVQVEAVAREITGGKVKLTTEIGHHLLFDEVVMTIPLGWLKRNVSIFDPPLPPRMLAGIEGISVGHLEKVILPLRRFSRETGSLSLGLYYLSRCFLGGSAQDYQ